MHLDRLWRDLNRWFWLVWLLCGFFLLPSWWIFGVGLLTWVLLGLLFAPGWWWTLWAISTADPDRQEQLFRKALAHPCALGWPYTVYGHLLARQKRWAEAIPMLETALTLRPSRKTRYLVANTLGVVYTELCRWSEARQILEDLVRDPRAPGASHMNLGMVLLREGDLDRALLVANHARRLLPKSILPWALQGQIYFAQGDYEEAERVFSHAIEISSTAIDSYYWLARTQQALGDTEKAVNSVREAIRRIEEDPDESAVGLETAQALLAELPSSSEDE